ncbi:hypothetical protein DFQ27_000629 [Actinomortierella ambigua]|uniref:NADP-dependent oxidoreductase domain-containing protein n=1 Tax=Actinomortierella ambigua TaxID=1343610 RepID=A0A9P6TW63_9FUNG|nr:hypothetical protein DFQ27_000629 [Actinomortierella ambigua]
MSAMLARHWTALRTAPGCRGPRLIPAFSVWRARTIRLQSTIAGQSATAEGTAAFLARHADLPRSTLAKRDWTLSKLGFGAYRVHSQAPEHREALLQALNSGVNVIDTSSHFGYGASETFIGETLQEVFKRGEMRRDQVVLVSKAGFIPTTTPEFPQEVLGKVPTYAKINDLSYHSIHPKFLESQITGSLERLRVSKLDIFMLNNPERMLGARNTSYGKVRLLQEIAEAFAYLDHEVQQGRIGGYGICSNAMHIPTTEDYLSLKALLKTANDFGWNKDNFIALQAPLNLFERDLVTDAPAGKALAHEAKENGIFVFTNRPLNAIARGQIITLENKGHLTRQVDDESLANKFNWSEILSENLAQLSTNYFAAKHFLDRQVLPAIDNDLRLLEESANQSTESDDVATVMKWIPTYREEAKALTQEIAAFCQLDSDKRNDELNLVLGLICPDFVSDVGPKKVAVPIGSPLSTKSIQYSVAHEDVGCVLVGMRQPAYVTDAVAAAQASTRLGKKELGLIAQCPLLLGE